MYIALTGYMACGKGEIAKKLQEKGYKYISLSDIVRREADKKGLEHTRENLQKVGNELREKNGPAVLGKMVRETILEQDKENFGKNDWVIDGVRNPKEVEELKNIPNNYLLSVTASDETIVNRIKSRKRPGEEDVSTEDILAKLNKEKGIGEDATGQQTKKCVEISDFEIINEGSFAQLEEKLNHFVNLISGATRPTFDEIFMEIAYTWAKRATCLRRRVGAVIAKDSQQLTAGYNGAPKGVPHCADMGGCLREKLGIPSGQRAEICRGTHAEQNAITQAAKFGINISGATLYCNTFPCIICTKLILNSGIEKIVYDSDYNDPLSKEMLSQQLNVKMVKYEGKKFKS